MNIHHLELFYYVARHGGISAAVRRMPYGIQQPAVSSQVLRLEEDLGVKLFERQPFRLTPEGEELLAFIGPFFDNVEDVGKRLRKRLAPQLRVGAAELVQRDHLPTVIQRVKASHPGIRLGLRSGFQPEIEAWLEAREIDVAVLPRARRMPPHTRSLPLLRLPLVLLVPKASPIKAAEELWKQRQIEEPLICLPPTEIMTVNFQAGLKRRRCRWTPSVEASSVELITQYVADGHGLGVNVAEPAVVRNPRVRVLPLQGFTPLELIAVWHGEPTPLVRAMLREMQEYVRATWPEAALPGSLPEK